MPAVATVLAFVRPNAHAKLQIPAGAFCPPEFVSLSVLLGVFIGAAGMAVCST